jgi:isopenicillin N synthase-like dioxygenase
MKANFQDVPVIDVTPLFSPDGSDRNEVDKAIGLACERVGFFVISGAALQEFSSPYRIERLLRFFQLNAGQLLPMARKRYVPANLNAYRGYFPTTDGDTSYKHGIDLGPEFDSDDPYYPRGHPLVERNLWPDEADLPGWRTDILAYYAEMLRLGRMLMHSVARYLGLIENWFDQSFAGTNSTLRLLRYPVRTAESLKGIGERAYVVHQGTPRPSVVGEHVDSGILTLLYQDQVGGLQAKNGDGRWIDVPAISGSYSINIGGALQRWTNGRFVATPHRVLGHESERYSIPFFFEPAVTAVLECIPTLTVEGSRHEPVTYGEYLIEAMNNFVETRDFAKGTR